LAQPFGKEARQFVAGLVLNKDVSVEGIGVDGYKRTLGVVMLGDGRVLNRELVSAGLAWFYDQHPNVDPSLPGLMVAARAGKKGLWADATPLAPWDFRGDILKDKAVTTVKAASDSLELPSGGAVFIDKESKEYHKSDCVLLDKTSRRSVMLQDAQAQGYSPCQKCFPVKSKESPPVVSAKGNLENVPKEDFSKYLDNPMVQKLGLTPYRDANGKFAGIAANSISSFLPAALLGFQDGDVLQSVNGDAINDPGNFAALFEKYKNSRSFEVGIIRNGRPQTMNITIPSF
jgi:hypothetical protein